MPLRFTPSACRVNLGAIARNFKRIASPERQMPVIKADAYGHGMKQVASILDKTGARRFAVGAVAEGLELRKEGFRQDILPLLGCMDKDEMRQSLAEKLHILIGSFADLEMLRHASENSPVNMVLKFDTGMGRLGFTLQDIPQLLDQLPKSPHLRPVLLLSHLACADMPAEKEFTQKQHDLFEEILKALTPRFPLLQTSLRNSAACATCDRPGDLLRPGIALYGGNPLHGTEWEDKFKQLEWAMSCSAPILQIREIEPGSSISYGRSFMAQKRMRVAVIGAGYASGVSRALSNKMQLLIKGKRARQVGRICMSMLMADISDIPEARAGDAAWILGGQASPGEKPVTAQEMADSLNTIPYEVMCLLGALNPRIYCE